MRRMAMTRGWRSRATAKPTIAHFQAADAKRLKTRNYPIR